MEELPEESIEEPIIEEDEDEEVQVKNHLTEEDKGEENKCQLTLSGLERPGSHHEEGEKKDIVIESPDFKVEILADMDIKRIETLKLPVTFGNTGQKQPKHDIVSAEGIELVSLGQSLYNFRFLREAGPGSRKIYLKNRECKIILEGTVYDNGTLGMTRLLAYSISKDLTFKRALEVYTFMQKVLAGNTVQIKRKDLNYQIRIPMRHESLKLLKIVEILYKYSSVAKSVGLNPSEKVESILKNAVQISELSYLMRGGTIETMVKVEEGVYEKLSGAKSLKIVLTDSIKLKKFHLDYIKEVKIPDFVLKNKEKDGNMSTSWKKAELTYKKVLD